MQSSKELHPNQLTWEERNPEIYYVEKIFISKYLNNKLATKTIKKAGSQKQPNSSGIYQYSLMEI